jgi:hypothetical protein
MTKARMTANYELMLSEAEGREIKPEISTTGESFEPYAVGLGSKNTRTGVGI